MDRGTKEKFLNYFQLPDELSLEEIEQRGRNFRETSNGKIKFDIIDHLPLLGSVGEESIGPARWHIFKTYTFDPSSHSWNAETNNVEFHYDKLLLVEEELTNLERNSLIQKTIEKGGNKSKMVEELLQKVKERFDNIPQAFETSDVKWEQMIEDLTEGLKPRLTKEIEKR